MNIREQIARLGVESTGAITALEVLFALIVGSLIGILVYFIAKKWLSKLVISIAGRTNTQWDDLLFDKKFFNLLGLLLAPIVIRISISTIMWEHMAVISKLLSVWIIFAIVMLIGAVLDGINRVYESYEISKNRPIKVFIQLFMIFLYCAAIMVIIGMYTGQSIAVLLTGLTAFAAVIMLIFKDSILGFVAGIQLTANSMVGIGDWIVMPSSGADGDVLEISLTTVKVQNWDKTITTIPTYKLVSESFTNWRGMVESQGRRIKRSVSIDINSIHYLTEKEISTLEKSALLKDYITTKRKELAEYNMNREEGAGLDERRLTNLGTFREYMELWLFNNQNINLDMTCMVRQLQSTPTGVPLEIYCFSARKAWVEYEDVQSDIFDHVFAVMELFHLRPFQYSSAAPIHTHE